MIDDAKAKLHDKYDKMASDLTNKHEQQMKDLLVNWYYYKYYSNFTVMLLKQHS